MARRPSRSARTALSGLTDEWLIELFEASGAAQAGATLVAVGGFGRRELSPGSDLDLVLLHPGESISEVADRLWYPIWDSGLRLDHSVRTVAEARRVAATDIKVVLGLLDARTVAGDEAATAALGAGAASVDVAVTHALFVGDALALLQAAGVRHVWSSDAVPHATAVVPITPLLAGAVRAF